MAQRKPFSLSFLLQSGAAASLQRLGLLAAVLFLLTAMIYMNARGYVGELHEGDIALKDMYAPYDFQYPAAVDEEKMDHVRRTVLASIHPLFSAHPQGYEDFLTGVSETAEDLVAAGMTSGDAAARITALRDVLPATVPEEQIAALLSYAGYDTMGAKMVSLTNALRQKNIVENDVLQTLKAQHREKIAVIDESSGSERLLDVTELIDTSMAVSLLEKKAQELFSGRNEDKIRQLTCAVVCGKIRPTLIEEKSLTARRIEEAYAALPVIYKYREVKKNEIIVLKGQRIGRREKTIIDAMEQPRGNEGNPFYFFGVLCLGFGLLGVVIWYLRWFKPDVYGNIRKLCLIGLLGVFFAGIVEFFIFSQFSRYLIPLPAFAILLTLLIGPEVALVLSVAMSLFAGIVAGSNFELVAVSLIGCCVAVFSVQSVRKRGQLMRAGMLAGLASFTVLIAIGFLYNLSAEASLHDALIGFFNGVVLSNGIVLILLAALETIFQITTDITLLEMSDLNHPLLRELVMKSPGTYHHSLLVGNLAEAASSAIGANSLLARVGAYYHDVGKILKPHYFKENETDYRSRHKNLTASMSAMVIENHVKDGIEIARRYRLPDVLIDVIRQHHGTGVMTYFYKKALDAADDPKLVSDMDFRYPGPKPQTREAAIVLLADSVEAAARAMEVPSPASIKGLVKSVINEKFIDGQLDECTLTFKDLSSIEESFLRVLTGMFHTRIDYSKKPSVSPKNDAGPHR